MRKSQKQLLAALIILLLPATTGYALPRGYTGYFPPKKPSAKPVSPEELQEQVRKRLKNLASKALVLKNTRENDTNKPNEKPQIQILYNAQFSILHNVTINTSLMIRGKCAFNGSGQCILFGPDARILIDKESVLTFNNVQLSNVAENTFIRADATAQIIVNFDEHEIILDKAVKVASAESTKKKGATKQGSLETNDPLLHNLLNAAEHIPSDISKTPITDLQAAMVTFNAQLPTTGLYSVFQTDFDTILIPDINTIFMDTIASLTYLQNQAFQQQIFPGPPGPQGLKGGVGEKGATGEKGAAGTQGLEGPSGPPGLQGPQGAQGASGTPGKNGIPGIPGVRGESGPSGKQGPAGPQGHEGKTAPVVAASSTSAGQGPSVTTIQGVSGAAGTAGTAGTQGPPGPPGPSGPAGPKGDRGPQGTPGERVLLYTNVAMVGTNALLLQQLGGGSLAKKVAGKITGFFKKGFNFTVGKIKVLFFGTIEKRKSEKKDDEQDKK